jgi:hypothetical protein
MYVLSDLERGMERVPVSARVTLRRPNLERPAFLGSLGSGAPLGTADAVPNLMAAWKRVEQNETRSYASR